MLKYLTTGTEFLMLAYWVLAAALALDIAAIDPSIMYSDYENPPIVAWNWSFFPIDIAFAVIGLSATYWPGLGNRRQQFRTIAATLMFCAGLMAISFWIITRDFSLVWWAANIWLIGLGLANLFSHQKPQETIG